MGSATTSSKHKKNPGEHRRKRKSPISRKRRHVSSSQFSYSSDSDDTRHRRSSLRKPDKRRGRDPKRSMKKNRLKARHRSVSSTSSDSGDPLDRSRSPVRHRDDRKSKFKKVKRNRKLDGPARSSRSRNRSLSCSTCSRRDSRSNSPRRIYRENKSKEMDGSRQIGSSSVIDSRGDVVGMYDSGDLEVDNKMKVANYDLPPANTGSDLERAEQDWLMDSVSYGRGVKLDRWMDEGNIINDSYFDHFEDCGAQTSQLPTQLDSNSDLSKRIKSEIVAASNHDSESDDLELMLRQKALENLSKLRGGISLEKEATNVENVSAGDESSEKPCETAKNIVSSSESDFIFSKQRQIQVGVLSDESNLNPVNKVPPMEPNYSTSEKKISFSRSDESRNSKDLVTSANGQNTSNKLNIIENSAEKMSWRQSTCRDFPEKNATAPCESDNTFRPVLDLGDRISSGNTFPDEKEKVCEVNETVRECQSVSQFEEKTFSRMHDGEMVQVSYKVYIPNKAPALARRKLQR